MATPSCWQQTVETLLYLHTVISLEEVTPGECRDGNTSNQQMDGKTDKQTDRQLTNHLAEVWYVFEMLKTCVAIGNKEQT